MNFNTMVFLLFLLCISFSCAGPQVTADTQPPEESTQSTLQSQTASEEPASPKLPIPPDCPLAKIREGMGAKQVIDILGQPTDQEIYSTGKQWIPFYFGSDVIRTVCYYKGIGQIHFSAPAGRVVEIIYDPTEDGYR